MFATRTYDFSASVESCIRFHSEIFCAKSKEFIGRQTDHAMLRYIWAYDFVYVFLSSFTSDFDFIALNFSLHQAPNLCMHVLLSHILYYGKILMIS